jgi:hypothetical protein
LRSIFVVVTNHKLFKLLNGHFPNLLEVLGVTLFNLEKLFLLHSKLVFASDLSLTLFHGKRNLFYDILCFFWKQLIIQLLTFLG